MRNLREGLGFGNSILEKILIARQAELKVGEGGFWVLVGGVDRLSGGGVSFCLFWGGCFSGEGCFMRVCFLFSFVLYGLEWFWVRGGMLFA